MTHAPRKANRWLLYGPLIAAGILLLSYFALWLQGAQAMRRSVEAWAEDQRAAGLEVSYENVRARGFPFYLRGAVAAPAIADPATGARWRADALYIDALPFALDRLVFSASNPQMLDLGRSGVWTLEAQDARASIGEDETRGWIVNAQTGPAALARADGPGRFRLEAALMRVAPSLDADGALETSLIVGGLAGEIDGKRFEAARIEAFLEIADAGEAGPEIRIKGLSFETEGARASFSGALVLDRGGYPAGVLQAEIINPAGLARALAKLGALTPAESEQAAAALTLAALGGGGKIAGSAELRDGAAYIAGVKFADLPRIE
ncbi:DUF2125 domain-containing protein [Amphiplicatus metriothermophilus]|uniref:DUF2125 domain-containing protein n=1 Tax=Amphiplicatus metriothermophilus TaxID=1519374 RepID=A0A239PL14_9PROT|nr:DUF2125 domain-containing protein [Amphiplicatus metriothermophilus]MBB5517912.1 hypothetical protein [Amphiplicatus metriothermophilus]SNT67754.1 hypothetical protein SAMN06297382_0247 [Amphiplicatus metriothermophilus]